MRFPRPLRRALGALPIVLLAACVGGCLTADGTLDGDGTGTLALSYKAPAGTSEEILRGMLTAPGVTVESLSLGADRTVSAKLKVTDLAGISKTKLLKDATVTKTTQGDDEVLTITYTNPLGRAPTDKTLPGPKIKITLPGPVAEANEKAVVEGSTVTWSFPLADWAARRKWELTARYRPAQKPAAAVERDGATARLDEPRRAMAKLRAG